MWRRFKNWFANVLVEEEDTARPAYSFASNDDDNDSSPVADPEETRAVVAAELRRLNSRITQSEEALYACQKQLTGVPLKIQTLFEALEGILLDSYDHDASLVATDASEQAAETEGDAEQDARVVTPLVTARWREVEYDRARTSARKDVEAMVAAILAQRDRLETRLVQLEVNLKALEVQRNNVQRELIAQTRRGDLAREDLIPMPATPPDMMFEMEVRENVETGA